MVHVPVPVVLIRLPRSLGSHEISVSQLASHSISSSRLTVRRRCPSMPDALVGGLGPADGPGFGGGLDGTGGLDGVGGFGGGLDGVGGFGLVSGLEGTEDAADGDGAEGDGGAWDGGDGFPGGGLGIGGRPSLTVPSARPYAAAAQLTAQHAVGTAPAILETVVTRVAESLGVAACRAGRCARHRRAVLRRRGQAPVRLSLERAGVELCVCDGVVGEGGDPFFARVVG